MNEYEEKYLKYYSIVVLNPGVSDLTGTSNFKTK